MASAATLVSALRTDRQPENRLEETPVVLPLLDVLAALRPARSRSDLRRLLADGRVTVNGEVTKLARRPIAPEDAVVISAAGPAPASPQGWPFRVVSADDDLLVVDKPAGLLTSTVPREKRPTALAAAIAWAAANRPRAKVGLVHRLDRDASGLLVFGLNPRAFASLKAQFFDRSAGRDYAVVVGTTVTPPAGTIRSKLVEYADGTVHTSRHADHGQDAVTHYETTRVVPAGTLLRVSLESGRKHQIRAHLAERGWPVVGDPLYGGSPAKRLMLAAVTLRLLHPRDGRPLTFIADTPRAFFAPPPSPGD